jgi:hypothetical protein
VDRAAGDAPFEGSPDVRGGPRAVGAIDLGAFERQPDEP